MREAEEAQARWKAEREALRAQNERLVEAARLEGAKAMAEARLREEKAEAAEQAQAAREISDAKAMSRLREEVQIARLAAQIASEHKEAELRGAHAALRGAKKSALRRLDTRWERMLLLITWQAWAMEHARRHGRRGGHEARAPPRSAPHASADDERSLSEKRSVSFGGEEQLRAISHATQSSQGSGSRSMVSVSYTHLRAHET